MLRPKVGETITKRAIVISITAQAQIVNFDPHPAFYAGENGQFLANDL